MDPMKPSLRAARRMANYYFLAIVSHVARLILLEKGFWNAWWLEYRFSSNVFSMDYCILNQTAKAGANVMSQYFLK